MSQDKTIKCNDCSQEFTFTAGESDFFKSKNLPDPQYCLICRGKYKAMERDAGRFGKQVDKVYEIRNNK